MTRFRRSITQHDRLRVSSRTMPAFAILLWIMPAIAQAQVLRIVDPPQWRESRPFTMQGRTGPFRIAGFVSQAGGIQRVLVNGVPAMLEVDPNFPDSYNFERIVPPDSISSEITITVEPRNGDAWSRMFTIELSTRPVDRNEPPVTGGARTPAPQTAGTQLQRPNPWGGFKVRGVIYGLAAVGGVVLAQLEKTETAEICEQTGAGLDCFDRTTSEPSYQTLGFAAAGAAVGIFIIDALLTSRRASANPISGRNDDGLQIEAPAVSASATGVTVDLLRLRFR